MEKEPIQVNPSWGNDKWSDPDAGGKRIAESGSDAAACSPSSTPETAAAEFPVMTWPSRDNPLVVRSTLARKLERERDAALDALCKIESHYVDGCDTYEAWKAMGEIASTFLAENRELYKPKSVDNT